MRKKNIPIFQDILTVDLNNTKIHNNVYLLKNHPKTLKTHSMEKTLNSLSKFNKDIYELIIVDGGSKDKTLQVIKENNNLIFSGSIKTKNNKNLKFQKANRLQTPLTMIYQSLQF